MKGMLRVLVGLIFIVVIQCFPQQLFSQRLLADAAKELVEKRNENVEIENYLIRRNPNTKKVEKMVLRVSISEDSPVVTKLKTLFMKSSESSPIFNMSTEKGKSSYFIKFASKNDKETYIGTLTQEKKCWIFEWIETFE